MADRQKLWIDRNVQGILVERALIYWIAGLGLLGGTVLCDQWWRNPNWTFSQHLLEFFAQVWPWLPSVLLLMPLVLFDVVRLSHQFGGPLYRLRKHLHELQDDLSVEPLSFRESDYWQELVGPVNWLHAQLLESEEKVKALEFILQSQKTAVEASQSTEEQMDVVDEPTTAA